MTTELKPRITAIRQSGAITVPAAVIGAAWCLTALVTTVFDDVSLPLRVVLFALGAGAFAYGSWGMLPMKPGPLPRKGGLLILVGFALVLGVAGLTVAHVSFGSWTWVLFGVLFVAGTVMMLSGTDSLKRAAGL